MSRTSVILMVLVCLLVPTQLLANGPLRVGEHVSEVRETPHPYPSFSSLEPQLMWVEEITFPGATYIAPHFERFQLGPDDFVVVRSPDGAQRWVYDRKGKLGLGDEGFFSGHIKGDTAVIELFTAGIAEAG